MQPVRPQEWSAGNYVPRQLAAREKLPNPKLPGMAGQQWGHLVCTANSLRLSPTSEDTAFSNVNDHAEPGREQSGRSRCLQGGEVGEAALHRMCLC